MSLFWSRRATPRSNSRAPEAARLLACGTLLFGCHGGSGVPGLGGPDGPDPQDGRSGQTGSPQSGPRECSVDSECQATGEALAEMLRQPSSITRSFSSARCEQVGLIGGSDSENRSGPTCVCDLGDGGALHVGPAGGDCQVRGRAGSCLWETFEGCDRFDAHSCDAVCSDLEQRLADDAQHSFDARLEYFDCERDRCRSVLSIDGACTPGDAIGSGKRYDCELGGPAILEQHARERAMEQEPDASREDWPRSSSYADGARGFVELGVSSEVWAGGAPTQHVYASAQFCDTEGEATYTGEVLDPLEGSDDCGVIRKGMWGASQQSFFQVSSAALELEGRRFPFSVAINDLTWMPDDSFTQLAPPHGASARFQAQGGALRAPIDVTFQVPAGLEIASLQGVSRIQAEPLHLRWSGRGDAPLRLLLQLSPQLADVQYFTELECLMQDDGEFEIPASVMSKLPQGIATATFVREARKLESAGGQKFLVQARVQRVFHLAVGERCERQDVLDACERFAQHQEAVFQECGAVPAPTRERTCPAYLAESCVGCAEYYDCSIKALRCENGSPTYYSGCSCPLP